MKTILLTTAAVALMAMSPAPSPIGAAVTRVGGNAATTCYHAAVARDASGQSMSECNAAVTQDAIPFSDLVASYVNRGVLKLVRADYRGAEADFNQAMGLDVGQPEAWLNKGISRYQQGDFQSARQMFSRAIELNTSYAPLAYFGRALANEDAGDIRAAYQDYQRASALDPKWDAPKEQLSRFKVVRKTNA
ncbi:MAG TPA: tetratricopeptide repeat protein [Sphingomicrobium sp.]|jgi:tetratricopeptide (TPR) repeat protein|nr:tetratricopeptide repeat protein [Sphingomicrobium sp.]